MAFRGVSFDGLHGGNGDGTLVEGGRLAGERGLVGPHPDAPVTTCPKRFILRNLEAPVRVYGAVEEVDLYRQ